MIILSNVLFIICDYEVKLIHYIVCLKYGSSHIQFLHYSTTAFFCLISDVNSTDKISRCHRTHVIVRVFGPNVHDIVPSIDWGFELQS